MPMKNSIEFDHCYLYDHKKQPSSMNGTDCLPQSFDNQTLKTCDNFVFNHEYFHSTIVTEYQLYCHNEWIVQVMQSLFFFGVLVGAIVNGILADKYAQVSCPSIIIFFTYFISDLEDESFLSSIVLLQLYAS